MEPLKCDVCNEVIRFGIGFEYEDGHRARICMDCHNKYVIKPMWDYWWEIQKRKEDEEHERSEA